MSERDFHDTLCVVNAALILLDQRRNRTGGDLRAQLRALSTRIAAIRFRLGHRAAALRRN